MQGNKADTNHKGRDKNRSNTGEEYNNDGGDNQSKEGLAIRELAAEESERGIRGLTEEIEEQPSGEESEEEDEGKRIGEEGNSENGGDDDEVIGAEIGVVLAESESGFGERFGLGEGRAIEEFRPRAAVGETGSDGFGDAGEERSDGREALVVGWGRLGIGDRKNGRDGGHFGDFCGFIAYEVIMT